VICGEFGSERCADPGSVGNDLLGGDGARCGEVPPRRVNIVGHVQLVGTSWSALAVATIVECEDIETDVMEVGESRDGVSEGAFGSGEEENSGMNVAGPGGGWNPPAG